MLNGLSASGNHIVEKPGSITTCLKNGFLSNLPWYPAGNLPKMRLLRHFAGSLPDCR
jgi:hypothetical protein